MGHLGIQENAVNERAQLVAGRLNGKADRLTKEP